MAWNTGSNKSLNSGFGSIQKKALSVGAPVVYNPGAVGKPYRDGWNIERAYKDGVASITWVFRAIDAIASNQAKLPVQLRKGNSFDGEIVSTDGTNLLEVLNSVANIGESSFAFRYRLSSQLLMSTRGVFIEISRNNAGKIDSLHLLPPQHTSPIPHATNFVSGFEVELGDGRKKIVKPENVVWIRKPHPLDPYRSITPMEAAGIAIEIEQLAKIYNRNFLLNDGRPGGLIVLRGEIEPEDREELESRFRGGPRRAGAVSVISSDDGADFIDTGASPRDLAYAEMRSVTKEEILSAFGVPESIIGNASGRTFSNAAEEGRVFWQETMSPHLELIARDLDSVTEKKKYVSFNTMSVPILVLSEQERQQFLLQEFNAGLTTANEYREGTGRERVKSELADSMLANPNLTAIGNTEKEMPPLPDPNAVQGQPQQDGGLGGVGQVPLDVAKGDFPVVDTSKDPTVFGDVSDDPAQLTDVSLNAQKTLETKEMQDFDVKSLHNVGQWQGLFERKIQGFFERQQRVVGEKMRSKKVTRRLDDGEASIEDVFDGAVWCRQLEEDLRPLIYGAYKDAAASVNIRFDDLNDETMKALADEQIKRACKANETTASKIATALFVANGLDDGIESKKRFLYFAIGAVYVEAETERKDMMSENEAFTAYNSGLFIAGDSVDSVSKTWVTRLDGKVRSEHVRLHGKTVGFGDEFVKGLRFPGDPAAPAHLAINCRCLLTFDFE